MPHLLRPAGRASRLPRASLPLPLQLRRSAERRPLHGLHAEGLPRRDRHGEVRGGRAQRRLRRHQDDRRAASPVPVPGRARLRARRARPTSASTRPSSTPGTAATPPSTCATPWPSSLVHPGPLPQPVAAAAAWPTRTSLRSGPSAVGARGLDQRRQAPRSAARRGTTRSPLRPSSPSPRLAWRSRLAPSGTLESLTWMQRSRSSPTLASNSSTTARERRRRCGSRSPTRAGGSSPGSARAACRLRRRRSARRARRSCGPAAPGCRPCSRAAAGSARSSSSASRMTFAGALHRRAVRLPLARAGVQDHAGGADPVADPQRVRRARPATCARISRSLLAQLIR